MSLGGGQIEVGPFIGMSGGARLQPGDYLNLACALGANRTLTKPFEREEMLEAVRELAG